jgi:hypothetical protein
MPHMTEPKRIRVTFDVATQSQAAELNAARQEIVAADGPRSVRGFDFLRLTCRQCQIPRAGASGRFGLIPSP